MGQSVAIFLLPGKNPLRSWRISSTQGAAAPGVEREKTILTTAAVLGLSQLVHPVLPTYTSRGGLSLMASTAPETVLINTERSSRSLPGEGCQGAGCILRRLISSQKVRFGRTRNQVS